MERSVGFFQFKNGMKPENSLHFSAIGPGSICFYQFIGGNMTETDELVENLLQLKEKRGLMIGIFRFPFRFEGKKRMQTAIYQYYRMRDICDSVVYFHSDGMLEILEPGTSIRDAQLMFNRIEQCAMSELETMIRQTGEMNIDMQDIHAFLKGLKGPLYLHTFEGESFDEPLKYFISAPYLPSNYADGQQMIINIGYTQGVDMDAFRQINLRLHDMFHKADLFKMGTYFIDEPGRHFKITLLINGMEDPYPRPENMKGILSKTSWMKWKWGTSIQNSFNRWFSSSDRNDVYRQTSIKE